jgi:hypothetical protein
MKVLSEIDSEVTPLESAKASVAAGLVSIQQPSAASLLAKCCQNDVELLQVRWQDYCRLSRFRFHEPSPAGAPFAQFLQVDIQRGVDRSSATRGVLADHIVVIRAEAPTASFVFALASGLRTGSHMSFRGGRTVWEGMWERTPAWPSMSI